MIVLFDVLDLLAQGEMPLQSWPNFDFSDIRPEGVERVELAFMCEDETHIVTYPEHPMLIPWYGCPVSAIRVGKPNTLEIYLEWEDWVRYRVPRWGDNEEQKEEEA